MTALLERAGTAHYDAYWEVVSDTGRHIAAQRDGTLLVHVDHEMRVPFSPSVFVRIATYEYPPHWWRRVVLNWRPDVERPHEMPSRRR